MARPKPRKGRSAGRGPSHTKGLDIVRSDRPLRKEAGAYEGISDSALLGEIAKLGQDMRGVRVCHVSSTPFGRDISDMLFAMVPLEQSLEHSGWTGMPCGTPRAVLPRLQTGAEDALFGASVLMGERDRTVYSRLTGTQHSLWRRQYDIIIVHATTCCHGPVQ